LPLKIIFKLDVSFLAWLLYNYTIISNPQETVKSLFLFLLLLFEKDRSPTLSVTRTVQYTNKVVWVRKTLIYKKGFLNLYSIGTSSNFSGSFAKTKRKIRKELKTTPFLI